MRQVADLQALTPTAFLEIGGGTCHNISYTMALLEGLPMDLVTIISSVNGVNTPNVDAVAACLATIPDGDEFTISMRHVIGEFCVSGSVTVGLSHPGWCSLLRSRW